MDKSIRMLILCGVVLGFGCADSEHYEPRQTSVSSAPLNLSVQRKVNIHGVTVFYFADCNGRELTGPLAGSPAASFTEAKMEVWVHHEDGSEPELIGENLLLDKEQGLLNSLCFGVNGDGLEVEIKGFVTGSFGEIPVLPLVSIEGDDEQTQLQ